MAAPEFDPRQVAFVDRSVNLPDECAGSGEIIEEVPSRVQIQVDLQTSGLVILADQWNSGWMASIDGQLTPVLAANHVLRGVVVPEGRHVVEFRYEPASFTWGIRCWLASALACAVWSAVCFRRHRE